MSTGSTSLGLRFPVGTGGVLDYAIANAPNLRAAFGDYARFQALLASGYEVRALPKSKPRVT